MTSLQVVLLLLVAVVSYAQEVVWESEKEIDTLTYVETEQVKLKNGFPRVFIEANYLIGNYSFNDNRSYIKQNFRETGFEARLKVLFLFHRLKPNVKASLIGNMSFRAIDFNYKRSETVVVNFFDRKEVFYSLGYGIIIGSDPGFKFMIEPVAGFQTFNRLKSIDVTFDGNPLQEDYFLIDDPMDLKFYKGLFIKIFLDKSKLFNRRKRGLSSSIPLALNFGITSHKNPNVFINSKYAEEVTLIDGTSFEYPENLFYLHFGLSFMF